MFLKTIGMKGFKSFADKTELVFNDGITSIVGPNGSGKSNISDAVKWVLGEQSIKNLRGGKMEDVIFAGTQFRKPVGLCQVYLTLDNTDRKLPIDYSDVTISRRLYRSGESEYYINNTQCRLKDINELFMDTGIGKEGYSIIGQGNIESILNGRPEYRRYVLEEAAGIVKFRWRKEESEKKLESTHENLLRIGDILESYEERLEPLKNEREKANEFLRLSGKLKEMRINLLVHSIEKLREKINRIKESTDHTKRDTGKLNSEFAELKLKVTRWNEQMENFNRENSTYRKNYYKNKECVQKIDSSIKLLAQQKNNIEKTLEKAVLELDKIKSKQTENINQSSIQAADISKLKLDEKEIDTELKEHYDIVKKIEKNIVEREKKYRALKENEIEHLRNISGLKNNIISIEKDIGDMGEKIQNIRNSCKSYGDSVKINSSTKDIMLSKIEDIKGNIKKYKTAVDESRRKNIKLNKIFLSQQKNLSELNTTYSKLEANYAMLVNFEEHYEGYNRTARSLMMEIKKGKLDVGENDCFLVGEVINLQKKFEICIEIALGGAISNIITKNENMAKFLINYLKKNRLGRATFLPLTTIKGRKILNTDRFKNIKGYVGIASELLECRSGFRAVMDYMLGRTIICTDMNSALGIAKSCGYRFKIVTLLGDVVNPGGSLTGGSIKRRSNNIIGRKRETAEISENMKDIRAKIENLNDKMEDNKKVIDGNNKNILTLKDKIYDENIEMTKMQGKLDGIKRENSKLLENVKISNREVDRISKDIDTNKGKLQKEKMNLEMLYKKQAEDNKNISQIEGELEKNKKDSQDKMGKLTQLKIKKAKIDENILNRSQELKRLAGERDELELKKSGIGKEIENCRKNIHICELKKADNLKNIDSVKLKIEKIKDSVKSNSLEITRLRNSVKKHNDKLEDLALVINKKEQGIHRMQLSLAKLSEEERNMSLKLKDDLEITYEDALKYKKDIDNLNRYNREILDLKNAVSGLGTVNLGAIEEYDSLKEKTTFLSSQRNDLVKSKGELEDVIDMMTKKMKALFKENFSKLRKNFNFIFRELFDGGSADLVLVDGDELTSDIDITVQPPGKKLQNINLLSGGEKGLSAIALLFAILKLKPAPFCILDEIEAALDEANVVRYAKFLKKFSEDTQFIVITHRKATMEVSDVMYGVTMEEKGVSKIVSVDLENAC